MNERQKKNNTPEDETKLQKNSGKAQKTQVNWKRVNL